MPPTRYEPPQLDAPPVYATGVNTSVADFLTRRRARRSRRQEPPPQIVGSKQSAAYRMHSYHTKLPPEGVVPFIERHTRPGDVVLDPFCGSGMTGVAALRTGRKAVLIDLSPAATFIAHHYCSRPDPARLADECERVLAAARPLLEPLYATRCRACGRPASARFTVWSERYACGDCGEHFSLWDVARRERSVAGRIACPTCGRRGQRGAWTLLDPTIVLIKYGCPHGCGGLEAEAEDADVELARSVDAEDWGARHPYPRTPIPTRGDEIARVHKRGIRRVDQLFTRRNLRAVATLWHVITTLPGLQCRSHLLVALTGTMPRASRTNKYIPALGMAPGPILGTMYIPGFHPEVNVLRLFERKLADVQRYVRSLADAAPWQPDQAVRISTQSAADLSNIPNASIDYVFTDPPFGSNIAYSELNFLWESWLGVRTDPAQEAIVSRTHARGIDDYQDMIRRAFAEVRRVLRPRGRASIVFHNTSAAVWRALQAAIEDAGLAVEGAVTFDRGPNQSFKQFTAGGTVTHDLVVTCTRRRKRARPSPATHDELAAYLRQRLAYPGHTGLSARKLYSLAIAHFLVRGTRLALDFADFRHLVRELTADDGS